MTPMEIYISTLLTPVLAVLSILITILGLGVFGIISYEGNEHSKEAINRALFISIGCLFVCIVLFIITPSTNTYLKMLEAQHSTQQK